MAKNMGPAVAAARAKGAKTRDAVERFVLGFCDEHGYGPSLAQIGAAVGIHEGSAAYPVKMLIAEGRLVRDRGVARSLRPPKAEA